MSCIAAPSGALNIDVIELPAGTLLHQLFSANYPAGGFHPGTGAGLGGLARPTRFAHIMRTPPPGPVPYLYAGGTLQCAIFETIFHDLDFRATNPSLRLTPFNDKAHCELSFHRPLRLARLHGTGLKRIRAERVDLIESLPPCYGATACWAQAIYDQDPHIDGLVWRSRRLDDQDSYVLFGDRVTTSDYTGRAASGPILSDSKFRALVFQEALMVDILLLP